MKSQSSNGKVEKRKVTRTAFSAKQVKDVEMEIYHPWQYFDIHWQKKLYSYEVTNLYIKEQNKVINREIEYPIYIIICPILAAVAEKLSFDVDDEFLIKMHSKYNSYWTSDINIEYHYIPLLNFSSESEIKLNDILEIQPLPDEFKTDFFLLYKSPSNSFDLNLHDLWHAKYMIIFKSVWSVGQEKSYGSKPLLTLLSSLRLLNPGNVGTKSRLMLSGAPSPSGITGPSGGPVTDFLSFRGGPNYNLSHQDLPKLKDLFEDISEIVNSSKYKSISTALTRFHLSYTRSHLTDRILDYSIALESLLLSDNSTELLYRMSIRAAWLLKDVFPPAETKEKLQVFYEMRSCIVHRGHTVEDLLKNKTVKNKLSGYYKDINEQAISSLSDNLVKEVIFKYLQSLKVFQSVREINKHIDEGIINWQ